MTDLWTDNNIFTDSLKHSPFELYKQYVSIKTHFSSPKYDFFHNHPHRVTLKSFEKRKDIWCFERLCRHKDPVRLILANIIATDNVWPQGLVRPEANEVYLDWVRRKQSLSYVFSEDLKRLDADFDANIKTTQKTLPLLLRRFIQGKVCFETVCIIVEMTHCLPFWSKRLKGEMLWETLKLKIVKYQPFLRYDKSEYRDILVRVFSERKGEE